MEVRSCRSCGKLYNYLGNTTPFCPVCMKQLEEKFEICKNYIYDNPGSNIQMVSDATEIPVKTIKQWVREERLSFAEGSSVGIECESCGAPILTGRYCDKCKAETLNGMMNAGRRPVKENPREKDRRESAKMRFLDT